MRKQLMPLGLMIIISTIIVSVVYAAATHFIKNEFVNIEISDTSQYVTTAVSSLHDKIDQLGAKATDWASWDETYTFVNNPNQKYIDSNLTDATLQGLGVTYMLYFNTDGRLVYLKSIAKNSETAENTARLSQYFSPKGKLLSTPSVPFHKGIVQLPDGPLMFFARPILTSDGEGPSHGTLVFAHSLIASDAAKISQLSRQNISYIPVMDKTLPPNIATVYKRLSDNTPTVIGISKDRIEGYQLIDDAYGKHILVAQVTATRLIYLEALKALHYFMLIVVSVILLGVAVAAYVLSRLAAKDKIIQVKDDFFSIASHELRTPLTAIKGNAQLLTQIYGEKNGKEFVEITQDITTSGDRLIRLVTNYLDAARLEQNRITLHNETFELREVAQDVVDELQGLAVEKGIKITNGILSPNLMVYADKDHVKQIFYNLIGNAQKFTEKGSITLTATTLHDNALVHITDTGRGISEAGKVAMFKKFEQTQKGDAAKGSGLGLYISKLLIEKMGGTIRLESTEVGKGTTISFTLPLGR